MWLRRGATIVLDSLFESELGYCILFTIALRAMFTRIIYKIDQTFASINFLRRPRIKFDSCEQRTNRGRCDFMKTALSVNYLKASFDEKNRKLAAPL